jgi:hypothetical protein
LSRKKLETIGALLAPTSDHDHVRHGRRRGRTTHRTPRSFAARSLSGEANPASATSTQGGYSKSAVWRSSLAGIVRHQSC